MVVQISNICTTSPKFDEIRRKARQQNHPLILLYFNTLHTLIQISEFSLDTYFHPRLRVPNKMQVLDFQTLAFFFFPFAPPNRLFSGQNQYFSKKFSVGPVSFVCLGAKLVKVGANGSLHRVLSLLFSSCPYLCGFLACTTKIYTNFQIIAQSALQHTQRPFLLRNFFDGYFPTRNYNIFPVSKFALTLVRFIGKMH